MRLVPVCQEPKVGEKHPAHRIYPYPPRGLPVTRPDRVRCTGITWIPMRRGFLCLVAVMERCSRKVPSRRLSNTMDAGFRVGALKDALAKHGPPEIFNSDQGSQFTGTGFTEVLLEPRVNFPWMGVAAGSTTE